MQASMVMSVCWNRLKQHTPPYWKACLPRFHASESPMTRLRRNPDLSWMAQSPNLWKPWIAWRFRIQQTTALVSSISANVDSKERLNSSIEEEMDQASMQRVTLLTTCGSGVNPIDLSTSLVKITNCKQSKLGSPLRSLDKSDQKCCSIRSSNYPRGR